MIPGVMSAGLLFARGPAAPALAALGARYAVRLVPGSDDLVVASAEGVFVLPAGAANTSSALRLLPAEFFGAPEAEALHPGLVLLTSPTELWVVARPPRQWRPSGHVCAVGGAALYRLVRSGPDAAGAWECTGRFGRLGMQLFVAGRAVASQVEAGGRAFYFSSDSGVTRCMVVPTSALAGEAMVCTHSMSVAAAMGVRFVYRGIAATGAA